MTLAFFSNYFNHHQKALCDEWFELLGEDFTFVETEPMEEFRMSMGWGIKNGESNKEYNMTDISPTIASLLRIQFPSGNIGNPIVEVIGK